MATLTIRLDDQLDEALTRIAADAHRSKSDVVREMLRRQTALDALKRAQSALQPLAEKAGYLTDEDFFRDFS
ncbi:MAG: ribbon-helix-helix protein, CopG family [Thiomonas sp.]|uniref:ribbon-helix-helix protein, CopG family n=1 Tax=Thiomonas sp. TaxID=2047785 RepID=UPI002A3672E9|nr:ribbon-helix-helix protein, CopG family [Thiomonas sp.]MDY0331678.1 ribbon-helix-helix protein, CopG family [Thiomonas sp.]